MITPEIKLANGTAIPQLGLGLWQIEQEQQCLQTVRWALEAGYRHFDTAQLYRNEFFLGTALRMSDVSRNDVFITTKIWNENQGWDDLIPSFSTSLRALQTDYVDLLLLHYPVPGTRRQAWLRMEELYRGGHVKAIGVSNYTIRHLEELLSETALTPVVNQVELHVFLQQPELLAFCKEQGIVIEAYSPLARGAHMNNPILQALARKHSRTPAQVMLRWCIQVGAVVIPKTVHRERLLENMAVFDFTLDKKDMIELVKLNQNLRTSWNPTNTP